MSFLRYENFELPQFRINITNFAIVELDQYFDQIRITAKFHVDL